MRKHAMTPLHVGDDKAKFVICLTLVLAAICRICYINKKTCANKISYKNVQLKCEMYK